MPEPIRRPQDFCEVVESEFVNVFQRPQAHISGKGDIPVVHDDGAVIQAFRQQ